MLCIWTIIHTTYLRQGSMRNNLVILCSKNGQWVDRLFQREIQGILLGFCTEESSQRAIFPTPVIQAAQRDRTKQQNKMHEIM